MKLIEQQHLFAMDLIQLLIFIREDKEVDNFSIGEVWRPLAWQRILVAKGYSQTLKSDHVIKMAADIYFWMNGKFIANRWDNKPLLEDIGDYWEDLDTMNYWGGYFKSLCDINHFGRRRL